MTQTTDHTRGLYKKYDVHRVHDPEGKHAQCSYFVLDLTHDPHALPALRAYARSCAQDYPQLAVDLMSLVEGNPLMPYRTHLPLQVEYERARMLEPDWHGGVAPLQEEIRALREEKAAVEAAKTAAERRVVELERQARKGDAGRRPGW